MQRRQDWAEHFSSVEEVSQCASAKILAAVAVTTWLDRPGVVYVRTISQSHRPVFSKGKGISSVSRRQDAIEHIDAGSNGGNDVRWRADAH